MRVRDFIRARAAMPPTAPLLGWVGRPYGDGRCWNLVRDAYEEVGGVELPESYYEATEFLTTARDIRKQDWGGFTPAPWQIVMLISKDRLPFVPLHSGLTLDNDRFLHSWGSAHAIITRFDDPEFRRRIAGFVCLYQRT